MSPTKNRGRKVWHITRFHQRYELPDDVRFDRKSPLLYTKDYVGSGTDDESCSYFKQMMELRTRPNWLELKGAFAELKNISANASKVYRGYLLDSNFQPASDEQIGSWLGLDSKESKELLIQLNQAGLIEQVTMPDFEQSKETKTKKLAKKTTAKKSTGKTKVTDKKKSSLENLVDSRRATRKHESTRDALNKKIKAKAKIKGKAKVKTNEKIDCEKKERKKYNRQSANKQKSRSLKGQDEQKTKPPTAGNESIEPTESDAGGSVIPFTGPLGSVKHTRTSNDGPQAIGSIIAGIQHRYSPDAKAFAADVFEALQLNCQPDSIQGRRELGCFASLWMDALRSGIPPPELDRLRGRAVSEAKRLRRYWRNRPGKIQAVWCKVFGDMVKKAKNGIQCNAVYRQNL